MDANSPAAAESLSRPTSPLTTAAEPSRTAAVLRRAGIAVAGVGVAALTAAACALSFEDLRALAVTGNAPADLAYLYPAAFDALLVISMIGVLLLRNGWWPIRLQAGVILTLLFACVVAAEVATATRMAMDVRQAAVVVAVAPWVMLILALWLWLLLIKYAAVRRAATGAALTGPLPSGPDILPFPGPPEHPDAPVRAWEPGQPGHPGQLVHHPAAEIMLDPHAAPPLEAVPHHDLPLGEPVIGPTAAPETPEVTEAPQGPPVPRQEPVPQQGKPMRWGDLVRPRQGDLLVHPPRPAAKGPGDVFEETSESRVSERVETWDTDAGLPGERTGPNTAEDGPHDTDDVSERDADTQPFLAVRERQANVEPAERAGTAGEAGALGGKAGDTPDPAHGAEAAEPNEEAKAQAYEDGAEAPPSGRMRSTPVPPGE